MTFRCGLASILCSLVLISASSLSALAQETLSEFEVGKIEFSLEDLGQQSFKIALHPRGGIGSLSKDFTATVFAITGPSRLVIDIPGISFGVDKKSSVSHSIIQRVRVGSHPDKTRFVVDMANEATPEYEVKTDLDSESIIISFKIVDDGSNVASKLQKTRLHAAQDEPKATPPKPISRPVPIQVKKNEPVDNERVESDPLKQVKNTSPDNSTGSGTNKSVKDADALLLEAIQAAQTKENTTSKEPVDSTVIAKTAVAKTPTAKIPDTFSAVGKTPDTTTGTTVMDDPIDDPINEPLAAIQTQPDDVTMQDTPDVADPNKPATVAGISFEQWPENEASAVVFQMKNTGTYQLLPQGDNRYELRLPNTKLGGNHLVLPQFPPEQYKEFDVIMARQTGDTVVIKIFISKGTKLFPAKIDNNIWLKTAE